MNTIGTSDWWRRAVVYQIYPRSFMDSNGDGIGDIAGAIEKLPYLKDLGVDAVWLTPWYLSPFADGGYDVADYRQIDPRFGTLKDAETFIQQAADMGIRTIVDIVPNHVSDQHPWFQAALAAGPGSNQRSRFWFSDGKGPNGDEMPTNWLSSFRGHTWTRTTNPDGTPGQWYLHLFTTEQPDLNWDNPEVRAEHEDILKFWFDRGAAGVRVDSAALIVKDPAMPDVTGEEAPGRHPFLDRDEIHEIYRGWRRVADSYDPKRVLVGEVWLDDPVRFTAYLRPDEMHTAFNFDFMSRPWDADQLRESISTTLAAHALVDSTATWVLSNHDVTRPVTRYGRSDTSFSFDKKRAGTATDLSLGTTRARAAFMLCAALPGSLYIYQGDELGLPEDEDLPLEAIEDPMHARSGGIDPGRDGCRVPLPWKASSDNNYGFSGVRGAQAAWLPQPVWWGQYAVETESRDPDSMLNFYRTVLSIRRTHFTDDSFEWIESLPYCLGFSRGQVACVVNFGPDYVPTPPGEVLMASGPIGDQIGPDIAVWISVSGQAGQTKGVTSSSPSTRTRS